jgi:protease-4
MSERKREHPFLRFLRIVFYALTGFFAVIGLGVTVLFTLLMSLVMQHADLGAPGAVMETPTFEKAVVRFELDGPIVTHQIDPADRVVRQLLGEPTGYSLNDMRRALRRAGEDIRVHGAIVNLQNIRGSFAAFTELRKSFQEFRATEKPLYINISQGDSLNYYLSSAGTKINLAPVGGMMIPGPVFQLTYFEEALDKLGIEFEVFRAGTYKSAFEPFVRNTPSEPTLRMYRDLEQSLRQEMVTAIAAGRAQSAADVAAWLQQSFFTGDTAVKQGLVDRLGYFKPWEEALQEQAKAEETIDWQTYLRGSEHLDEPRIAEDSSSQLAYLEATGEIRMDAASGDDSVMTPERVIRRLRWARDEESIKAVVLRVDSPGGSALASDLIWEEVRLLAEAKPVVALMGNVAASGGYYISAPATKIMAQPSTITGSIGVIGASVNGEKFPQKYGVHFHVVTQSERSRYLNFGETASEQDKALLAASIDEVYQTFLDRVASGRKMTVKQVDELAQGRVYTGARAKDLGLVDELGGRDEAFRLAKELAELNPEKLYPLAQYRERPRSILDCLGRAQHLFECLQQIDGGLGLEALWSARPWLPRLEPAQRLYRLLEDDHLLMYWPGHLGWSRAERGRYR